MKYSAIAGVVMDMDGVLWRGEVLLPGVVELFAWLHEREIPYAMATNNSSKTPVDYVEKLAGLGIGGIAPERILNSSIATALYLKAHYPAGTVVHVLGMKGVVEALEEAGFDVDPAASDPQIVVSGIDFEMTYNKLKRAALHIRNGAAFIGTNGDLTFPTTEGLVPGAGSILAALEAATGQAPLVIGKPGRPMFEAALGVTGTSPEQTLMIGDRLDTDIAGAQAVGMPTALVFTGVTSPDDLSSADNSVWPDVAYEGLLDLLKAWAGDAWVREKLRAARGRG